MKKLSVKLFETFGDLRALENKKKERKTTKFTTIQK